MDIYIISAEVDANADVGAYGDNYANTDVDADADADAGANADGNGDVDSDDLLNLQYTEKTCLFNWVY